MKKAIAECLRIVELHRNSLEKILCTKGTIEVLSEVKKEHQVIGNVKHIEGVVCSETRTITIYPCNIWLNHCGLYPEPYNWIIFRDEVLRVFAHEMRHLWQLDNNRFHCSDCESDADDFAINYMESIK